MAARKAQKASDKAGGVIPPQPIAPTRPATAFQRWAPPISVFMLSIVVYLPSLKNGFVSWDDDHYVYDNRQLVHSNGLRDIWTNTKFSEFKSQGLKDSTHQYYPLVFTLYWLEHRLYGDNASVFKDDMEARGYHATSMVLHAVNGVLLLLLLHRLGVGVWPAWLVAALFAVHPMNVASVAWAAERKNLLSLCFYMLAMISYLRFRRQGGWGFYLATFLLFQCALWSKTVALTFPVVLLLTDSLIDRRSGLPGILLLVISMIVIFGLAYLPVSMIDKGWKPWHSGLLALPLGLVGGVAIMADRQRHRHVSREALRKLALVIVCCVIALLPTLLLRERWAPAKTAVRFLPAVLGIAVTFILAQVASRRLDFGSLLRIAPMLLMSVVAADTTSHMEERNRKVPLVAHQRPFVIAAATWFYPVKLLAPVNQLPIYHLWNPDPINYERWEPSADAKWWIPIAGLAVAGWVLFHWRRKITDGLGPQFWWGLAFYFVTQCPMLGFKNINIFQFAYVQDHYIYNGCAGVFLMMALGLDALRRKWSARGPAALVVSVVACAGLAIYGVKTWRYIGTWKDSETFWTTTLSKNRGCWAGWFNLANQYKREALAFAKQGDSAQEAAYLSKAAEHYASAIEAKINLHNAYEVLADLLRKMNRKADLERFCDQEIAVNPDIANAYYYKGWLRQEEGQYAEALQMYQKALNPKSLRLDVDIAHNAGMGAGVCLMKLERWADALRYFERAVEKYPRKYELRMNLGFCYLKLDRMDEAEVHYREAAKLKNDGSAQQYLDEIARRRQGGS